LLFLIDTAEIVLSNPQTPGRRYHAPLFQQYLVIFTFEILYIIVVKGGYGHNTTNDSLGQINETIEIIPINRNPLILGSV